MLIRSTAGLIALISVWSFDGVSPLAAQEPNSRLPTSGNNTGLKPESSPASARTQMKSFRFDRRAIYRCDDRREAEDLIDIDHASEKQLNILKHALTSVALITQAHWLKKKGHKYVLRTAPNYVEIDKPKDADGLYRVCREIGNGDCEKRINMRIQRQGGFCTGFLVRSTRGKEADKLVTAGHCLEEGDVDESNSNNNAIRIVFGFRTISGKIRNEFASDQVFDVKKVIEQKNDDSNDFAVLRLDRTVPERVARPLKLIPKGARLTNGQLVGLMGHPNGLPLKFSYSKKSKVTGIKGGKFTALLDSFHGNSGAPVFLQESPNVVAGILVSGNFDYDLDKTNNCAKPLIYEVEGEENGETVVDISVVRKYIP